MDRNKLKPYAPAARRDFIKAVTEKANLLGLSEKKIEPASLNGDVAVILGKTYPKYVYHSRLKLINKIEKEGFERVIERIAYTWFNRFLALRFMEIHSYLGHGYRVLSNPTGRPTPEILENADRAHLANLNRDKVVELKLAGARDPELYSMLLVAQCNELHKSMPFLFEEIDDESELLLPDNLLHTDSLIRKLVNEIPKEDWQEVEIIGWIYQFYISEKKDQVIGRVVKSEDIPAATQLFTPNWIVKYMVQNSLGRKWLSTYPESKLRDKMEYYIEPVEQTPEVQTKLAEITPNSLDPEKITLMDPACGSGHILVEAYDIFKEIYLERGYRTRDIPRLIIEKNLYGLDIDDRAAQLAGFALLMKARKDDSRVLSDPPKLNVMSIQDTTDINASELVNHLYEFDHDLDRSAVAELVSLFKLGKTVGSLIRIPDKIVPKLSSIKEVIERGAKSSNLFVHDAAVSLEPIINQAISLGSKYDCVVANPPYMGSNGMNGELKEFAGSRYPDTKSDLCAMFIERNRELTIPHGLTSMITMQSWMFLSSFEKMRTNLLANQTISSLIHLGPRAFEEISGEVVQTCSFVEMNEKLTGYRPTFFRLVDENSDEKRLKLINKENAFFHLLQRDFHKVPGSPIAYWANTKLISAFQNNSLQIVGHKLDTAQGMKTLDNERFIRKWPEVSHAKTQMSVDERGATENKSKWYPVNHGGEHRKWYGNNDSVLNWENDGQEIKSLARQKYDSVTRTVTGMGHYFKPGITWTAISSSKFGVRRFSCNFLFTNAGMCAFGDSFDLDMVCCFLNSKISLLLLEFLSPTINFGPNQIQLLPIPGNTEIEMTCHSIAKTVVGIAKNDWDSFETSWDFTSFPWIASPLKSATAQQSFKNWETHLNNQIKRMQELETENNRLWIEVYGLQHELDPEVPTDQITLAIPDAEKDIKRLISYAIGCMMGRYSLDEPGLIYANSGNIGFELSRYKSFAADQDGILPVTDIEWFPDDVTIRFVEFVKTVWSTDTLEENLRFIAEGLDGKQVSDSREVIRKYLSSNFYKDHLQTYKNRPIYWLFSSGKQKAFECLVYLHRYNESTLSRMRSEYVIPLQGKINWRIQLLEKDLGTGSKGSEAKVRKELEALKKKQTELITFDENLRHYADMRISLDLDDGVKVNYGKFGNLLAGVDKVTGKK